MNTSHPSDENAKSASGAKPKVSDKELDALVVDRQKKQLRKSVRSVVSVKGWLIASGFSLVLLAWMA